MDAALIEAIKELCLLTKYLLLQFALSILVEFLVLIIQEYQLLEFS